MCRDLLKNACAKVSLGSAAVAAAAAATIFWEQFLYLLKDENPIKSENLSTNTKRCSHNSVGCAVWYENHKTNYFCVDISLLSFVFEIKLSCFVICYSFYVVLCLCVCERPLSNFTTINWLCDLIFKNKFMCIYAHLIYIQDLDYCEQ